MFAIFFFSFFFLFYRDHRDLHSFPTRRSSDLRRQLHRNWRHAARFRQCPFSFGGGVVATAIRQGKYFVCPEDRKSTRLNSSHLGISYAVFCLKKKTKNKMKAKSTGAHDRWT